MPPREDIYMLVREYPDKSIRWLAKRAGVSHVSAQRLLAKLRAQGYQLPHPERTIGLDGRSRPARRTAATGTLSFVGISAPAVTAQALPDIAPQAAEAPRPALDPPESTKPPETPAKASSEPLRWDW